MYKNEISKLEIYFIFINFFVGIKLAAEKKWFILFLQSFLIRWQLSNVVVAVVLIWNSSFTFLCVDCSDIDCGTKESNCFVCYF